MHIRFILCLVMLGNAIQAEAGKKLKVLFIGNSYTYYNSMQQIVADMASSAGDTLLYASSTPGGFSFMDHYTHAPTLSLIQAGGWDYVVLQDQSAAPALPPYLFEPNVLPFAKRLDSLVRVYSPCAQTMYYMTWGYKNGSGGYCSIYSPGGWPNYCTYSSMDSTLRYRYMLLADSTKSDVSPVGPARRYIRATYPGIELYDADESHPSVAGSYTSAACFYTALFRRDPSLVSFNFSLDSATAANIRNAVKKVVYDSMQYWHIGQYRTESAFKYTGNTHTITFTNSSANATGYTWHFGDGQTATTANPAHTYTTPGSYTAMLVATNGGSGCNDTSYGVVNVFPVGISQTGNKEHVLAVSPNPCYGVFTVNIPAGPAQVSVLNIYGQVVYSATATGRLSIDIHHRPAGTYIVRVTTAHGRHESKLVVQ